MQDGLEIVLRVAELKAGFVEDPHQLVASRFQSLFFGQPQSAIALKCTVGFSSLPLDGSSKCISASQLLENWSAIQVAYDPVYHHKHQSNPDPCKTETADLLYGEDIVSQILQHESRDDFKQAVLIHG